MYAELHSPLPGLTVDPTGEHCCGFRGHLGMLGQDDSVDLTNLPLSPIDTSETLSPLITPPTSMIDFPNTIGTEFTSNGDGTYTNLQTGQSVPYGIAQQITAATTGAATSNVQTQGTEVPGTIVDPNTGQSISTNNLSAAAQALNAAGQLVTAAGKLTAQGQTLLHAGNLYNPAPTSSSGIGAGISSAVSSLTSWFTQSSLVSGFPNYGVVGVVLLVGTIAASYISSRPKRRTR